MIIYTDEHLSAHELRCSSNDWLATPTRTFPLKLNSTPCGFNCSNVYVLLTIVTYTLFN